MKVSTKKHRATIFQCILSSRETFGEVVPKILLNAPLCTGVKGDTNIARAKLEMAPKGKGQVGTKGS